MQKEYSPGNCIYSDFFSSYFFSNVFLFSYLIHSAHSTLNSFRFCEYSPGNYVCFSDFFCVYRTSFQMFSFSLILFILATVLWIHSVFVNILLAIMVFCLIFLACIILLVKFFPFFLFYSFGSVLWIQTFFVKSICIFVIFLLLWNVGTGTVCA